MFSSPFSLVQLELSVTLRSIKWDFGNVKIHVQFNLMNLPQKDTILSLKESDLGEYGVAINTNRVEFPSRLDEMELPEGLGEE